MELYRSGIIAALLISVAGCGQKEKDKDIKADITTKAQSEIAFAGVHYTVNKGVVDLWGTCPSEKEKHKVETTVGKIAGVKKIINQVVLGPVVLDENFSLKQSVDSALKNYSLVSAQVSNGIVTLTGEAKADEVQKIQESLQKLSVNIDNRIIVQ